MDFMQMVLYFQKNPEQSIPKIIEIMQEYGTPSGYKFNLRKTELLDLKEIIQTLEIAS